jgi:hypothetical protein
MVLGGDFLLPALAPALGTLDELLGELLISCPEISENKDKEWACGEPVSITVHSRDYGGDLDEYLHYWKVGNE